MRFRLRNLAITRCEKVAAGRHSATSAQHNLENDHLREGLSLATDVSTTCAGASFIAK